MFKVRRAQTKTTGISQSVFFCSRKRVKLYLIKFSQLQFLKMFVLPFFIESALKTCVDSLASVTQRLQFLRYIGFSMGYSRSSQPFVTSGPTFFATASASCGTRQLEVAEHVCLMIFKPN